MICRFAKHRSDCYRCHAWQRSTVKDRSWCHCNHLQDWWYMWPWRKLPKTRKKCISGHSEVEFAEQCSHDSTVAAPFLCSSAKSVLPTSCKGVIKSHWSLQEPSCAISISWEERCPGITKRFAILQSPCCSSSITGDTDTGLSLAQDWCSEQGPEAEFGC